MTPGKQTLRSRGSRRFAALRHLTGLGLLLGLSLPLQAATPSDQSFRAAFDDARAKRFDEIQQVAVNGHVLEGYIEYHQLKARLPYATAAEVLSFIERHADSPLAEWMRGQAISAYGRTGRHDALLEVSDGVPAGAQRQCYYYTAQLSNDVASASQGGLKLWHVSGSQDSACDPLFSALRERGVIDDQAIWERAMLAWAAGQGGMVSYLERQLPSSWQRAIAAREQLEGNFAAITRLPTNLGHGGHAFAALSVAAMHGFVRADIEAALEAWRKVNPHMPMSDEQRHTVERDLAWYSLVRDIPNNRGWVDQRLTILDDEELFDLRMRNAVRDGDWPQVREWVLKMPDRFRNEARYQYWLGRADDSLGRPQEARAAWTRAATERNFYGFLAADRIGQAYSLNRDDQDFSDAELAEVAETPAVKRVRALMNIDEIGLARSEWFNAVTQADDADARRLAAYALQQKWYDLTVFATIRGQLWDGLSWRFPPAWQQDFQRFGANAGVDPWMLMALARRESAFNPTATSPVGARGLMQLMPGTAAQVSRGLGLPTPSNAALGDPVTNIRLGSTYIREMLDRYSGNRLAAAAAYNAGPGRVDRWLADTPGEYDRFVERIPFKETREYVKAVLAYRVIFESLAKGTSEGVKVVSDREVSQRYTTALVDRR
ncbi:transglycosylase SLT domain-containing protein [Cobetia amphilecti]|uniref:Transglycosylase SLT domain-containing protein n=1 Tax=Cobetia amphilecti TaxID=1055104 RepID=A0AAP4TXI4_9GAMM|nr:transglycosylase SLT domain-containing protein [Cobetia amphilecti]MDO6671307.1 transglycosylase SLT domain-containing protein [Cobetia amphilecti]